MTEGFQWRLTDSLHGVRNPGLHWKRRGHRGEEDDTEEDVTKDMDDSSAGASMEEGSMSKSGTYRVSSLVQTTAVYLEPGPGSAPGTLV